MTTRDDTNAGPPGLTSSRLDLKAPELTELDELHDMLVDSETIGNFIVPETDANAAREFIERCRNFEAAFFGMWVIWKKGAQNPIGLAMYHEGAPWSTRVGISYYLVRQARGAGLATEAVATMIEHLFSQPHLRRIEAEVAGDNEMSAKLLERLGFRFEGLLRDRIQVKGEWTNGRMYSLLKADRRPPLVATSHL